MTVDMPAAEVEVSSALVSSLLAEQRPDLAHLEVGILANGWDNVSLRVGSDLVARLPRRAMAAPLVENEARWLPILAPRLPLDVPVPVFIGRPGHGYPWPWTLVSWIPGESAALAAIDQPQAAPALADFLLALHIPAASDAPLNPYRSVPLSDRDEPVRDRIATLSPAIDHERATSSWERALEARDREGSPTWIHGDLHPHNLLVADRRLTGVIDFGDICAGDPATDLAIAWTLFDAPGRMALRDHYGGDEALWQRARGWALHFSLAYLASSADNPVMAAIGARGLSQILDDEG